MLPFVREDVWENMWYLIWNIFQVLQMPCSYKGAIKMFLSLSFFFFPLIPSGFRLLIFLLSLFHYFFLFIFVFSFFSSFPLSSFFLCPPLSTRTINSTMGSASVSIVELLQLFWTWWVLVHIFLSVNENPVALDPLVLYWLLMVWEQSALGSVF